MEGINMEIVLKDTWENEIEKAISAAKEYNARVIFYRDGNFSTGDLRTLMIFQKAGFKFRLETYEGKYDKEAIKVTFWIDSKAE